MTDTKGLGPTEEECRVLLQRVLDTRTAEAKALHAMNVAEENYTFADAECNAYAKAAGEASQAERDAREFLTRSAPVADGGMGLTDDEIFKLATLHGNHTKHYGADQWSFRPFKLLPFVDAILSTSKPQDAASTQAEPAIQQRVIDAIERTCKVCYCDPCQCPKMKGGGGIT